MANHHNIYSSNVVKTRETYDFSFIDDMKTTPPKFCQQTTDVQQDEAFLQLHLANELLPVPNFTIETAQKWLTLPGKNGKQHKFPVQTILPKVQMERHVPLMHLPRDVEVDRRRRQYSKMDLLTLLEEANISNDDLLPTEDQYLVLSESTFKHFLPISFFDDTNFDCHSPEAWFKLGVVDDELFPLPAKAYLPNSQNLLEYSWQNVSVSEYNQEAHYWKVMVLTDECIYHVPKVQIMFMAENPRTFVQRLKKAVEDRNTAECLIQMETIVDCVLMQDLNDDNFYPNPGIEKLLRNAKCDPSFLSSLRTEIYLVFEQLMACYEFEKFIIMMPKEFPSFHSSLIRSSLPKAFESVMSIKERKFLKQLNLNMKQIRHNVMHCTLFYIGAGIEAMESVASECQYIETLSIFVCTFSKPLPLNDFLQSQQQNSHSVSVYLKSFWPSKISAGICLVLRALGKGWLDISLNKWSVYEMCKISRFTEQTKFRMQESMQVLLVKSIENFSRFLIDPCRQFLYLTNDYKWPADDFINSDFPWPKPVFSLIIGISEDECVFLSTPPEEFEPALTDIFKKALEKTSGVRCIYAETLSNLRFAPNLYIFTVELIEDLYIECNDLLRNCYKKAVIPLRSYMKLFERFIPFYLLNVNQFFKDYDAANPTSLMVKQDILLHKRMKEELREILPATITIGPFLINVDPIKQFMIKKRIEIVKRLFEYYIQRMYAINEALHESCLEVYNKISERPQSIEHLYEIRDYSLTVPERVDQLKGEIQIMWLEYDMLDGFFYNLSDAQFAMKWEVYAWPHIIMQRLSTLREEQKTDIDEFRRQHLSEVAGFEERLESLNGEIQEFSFQFDPNRVVETAVEVKKTWKSIMEVQKAGEVLKFRQSLFDLEELSFEFLYSIIKSFTPYRTLWLSCADFIKLEEATLGNPLVNVVVEDVRRSVDEIYQSLMSSFEIFEEKPEIQEVAKVYLDKIDSFKPIVLCIGWLKNEYWMLIHWQELSQRSGMELKYTLALNFQYCLRKGIAEHYDLVKELSDKAEAEADAIRKAMEEEERLHEEARVALLMKKALRKCRRDILGDPINTKTSTISANTKSSVVSKQNSRTNLKRFQKF